MSLTFWWCLFHMLSITKYSPIGHWSQQFSWCAIVFLITIQFLVSITTKRHLQGKCTMDEEEIWWDHWSLWLMDRVAWCVKNNQFYFLCFPIKLMRLAAPIVCSSPLSWDPSHHKTMSKGDKTPSMAPSSPRPFQQWQTPPYKHILEETLLDQEILWIVSLGPQSS
jgi:hypothetical protein